MSALEGTAPELENWESRGGHDRSQGVPRHGHPTGRPEITDAWLRGWDAAADEDPGPGLEMAEVKIRLYKGRFYLVDNAGRMLGVQARVDLSQDADGIAAAVTFLGLSISAD